MGSSTLGFFKKAFYCIFKSRYSLLGAKLSAFLNIKPLVFLVGYHNCLKVFFLTIVLCCFMLHYYKTKGRKFIQKGHRSQWKNLLLPKSIRANAVTLSYTNKYLQFVILITANGKTR